MQSTGHRSVLTREELDELLAAAAASRQEHAGEAEARGMDSPTQLDRQLEEFGIEQSRLLSTQYQRPIRFERIHQEELCVEELTESLLVQDRIVAIPLEEAGESLLMVLGRSLFYEWLTLAFGGMATPSRTPIPARDYSRIELRLLRRIALDLARPLGFALDKHIAEVDAHEVRAIDLAEFRESIAPDLRLDVQSFDVVGLGEASRLRVLLPARMPSTEQARPMPLDWRELPIPMLEAPVKVTVEAGRAELALRDIAGIQVGDCIPLEPAHPDGLLVRVEDEAKFAAIRGTLGERLAVQLGCRV